MTDWLEELLRRAAEQEELGELPELSPLTAGASVEFAASGDDPADPSQLPDLLHTLGTASAGAGRDNFVSSRSASGEFLWGGGKAGQGWPAGLYALYRQTANVAAGIGAMAAPARTLAVQESAPPTPGLTVEGLDRAVRRDSRRYDGGMSIY